MYRKIKREYERKPYLKNKVNIKRKDQKRKKLNKRKIKDK